MKDHVDPQVIPYTVLVDFRTDIWTHPKRDTAPTPSTSPKTTTTHGSADKMDDTIERLREVRPMEMASEGQGQEQGGDNEEDDDDDGKGGLGRCFGGCLGLRGGEVGSRYIDDAGSDMEGYEQGETGPSDSEDEDSGDGVEGTWEEKTLAEGSEDKGAKSLKRADPVGDLRAMDKRYDPDAQSAYSRSTGTGTLLGRSREYLLIGGAGGSFKSRTKGHEGSPKQHCSHADHVWRRRRNSLFWMPVCLYIPVQCGGCREEVLDIWLWVCDLQVCEMDICNRCKDEWEKQRVVKAKEI